MNKTRSKTPKESIKKHFLLFMGPVLAAFIIGFVWPFIQGIYLSFCKFRLIKDAEFIGFSNYGKAFSDASFRYSFEYTAVFAVVSLVLINVLAFTVAYILTQNIKGSNLFRTVFFMPNLIGGIVLGYIWAMIFDGILSRYSTSILLETKYGFWGLIILMIWQQVGYMMIIYIAGLQAVPDDMVDAVERLGPHRFILQAVRGAQHRDRRGQAVRPRDGREEPVFSMISPVKHKAGVAVLFRKPGVV